MKKSMHGVIDPYGLGFLVMIIGAFFANAHQDDQRNTADKPSYSVSAATTATSKKE